VVLAYSLRIVVGTRRGELIEKAALALGEPM